MQPLHSAVYRLTEKPPDFFTRAMAAALRLRGDAILSHRTAGVVWEMIDDEPPEVELTLVGRQCHPLPGTRVHRVGVLEQREARWRKDLPVTSPARTLLDLAAVLDVYALESALGVCRDEQLCRDGDIEQAIAGAPANSAGIAVLRGLVDQGGFARTRSLYERKLLKLLAQAGLPRPITNHRVAGHEVDVVWLDKRLVLEFDSFRFHRNRRSFENDRRRDQDLVAAGYRVIRITARQLDHEPLGLIARLAAALAA